MIVCAIDPGNERSAYVVLGASTLYTTPARPGVIEHGKIENETLRQMFREEEHQLGEPFGVRLGYVVFENMSPRGLPTSKQEMATLVELGRLVECATRAVRIPERVELLARDDVKYALAGRRNKVNDSAIRALLIDRYGDDGGKEAAIGRKASPGPLYGIAADEWSALALGCAWLDRRAL